jgi:hypothetical protein
MFDPVVVVGQHARNQRLVAAQVLAFEFCSVALPALKFADF